MKIVQPSVSLEWITPNSLQQIELAGRTCYKSEPKGKPEEFVRGVIKRGHESVLEHASASFRIVCDRGISHELVRHRICSFSQESSRYVNYGTKNGEIQVIRPTGITDLLYEFWESYCRQAENGYLQMLAAGAPPQMARSLLPTCTKTELVMTANFREWRTILKLRTASAAHPDMQVIAKEILFFFRSYLLVIVEDIP